MKTLSGEYKISSRVALVQISSHWDYSYNKPKKMLKRGLTAPTWVVKKRKF